MLKQSLKLPSTYCPFSGPAMVSLLQPIWYLTPFSSMTYARSSRGHWASATRMYPEGIGAGPLEDEEDELTVDVVEVVVDVVDVVDVVVCPIISYDCKRAPTLLGRRGRRGTAGGGSGYSRSSSVSSPADQLQGSALYSTIRDFWPCKTMSQATVKTSIDDSP